MVRINKKTVGNTKEYDIICKQVIEEINSSDAPVLAVDIPSGLDCDTGKPLGQAVRAVATVTFVARKKGFNSPGADAYTGQVLVADIGAPRELIG